MNDWYMFLLRSARACAGGIPFEHVVKLRYILALLLGGQKNGGSQSCQRPRRIKNCLRWSSFGLKPLFCDCGSGRDKNSIYGAMEGRCTTNVPMRCNCSNTRRYSIKGLTRTFVETIRRSNKKYVSICRGSEWRLNLQLSKGLLGELQSLKFFFLAGQKGGKLLQPHLENPESKKAVSRFHCMGGAR